MTGEASDVAAITPGFTECTMEEDWILLEGNRDRHISQGRNEPVPFFAPVPA